MTLKINPERPRPSATVVALADYRHVRKIAARAPAPAPRAIEPRSPVIQSAHGWYHERAIEDALPRLK